MAKQSITQLLSQRLVHWQRTGFSRKTLETAKYYLLDWLGSAFAGRNTAPGQMLLAYGRSQPDGPCTILGSRLKSSAEAAALVNGALSHIVEMDDLHRESVLHPGAVVIPAALAVAERQDATGSALLSAIVAGYEVAIRIGEAVGKRHYRFFHNTSTCGMFGAAAAAGWILGLDEEQLAWALGNAGTQSSGLWQFNEEGAMSKHLHAGRAAAGGVLAADLAALGFTGARFILEGERGLFAATAPDANPRIVLAGIDDVTSFKMDGVSIKPHASCRHTHPAIDAALELRSQLDAAISRIRIETYRAALDLCDNPKPYTPYEAKFSLHYCVASALLRGGVGLGDFSTEAIEQSEIRDLLTKTSASVRPDYEAEYPSQWAAAVHLVLEDGVELSASVAHPKGDPEKPLSLAELKVKFRQLAAYGGYDQQVDDWMRWIMSLDQQMLRLPVKTQSSHRADLER